MAQDGTGNAAGIREYVALAEEFGSEVDVKTLLQDPGEVIESIEKFGTAQLGEFELEEKYVVHAFKGQSMLTMGMNEQIPTNWRTEWEERLKRKWDNASEKERQRASGFTQRLKVEAHVVGIQHAAGPPGIGLLQPVLVRWQSKAAPLSAFALPAVQAILNYKWTRWAKKVLMMEFVIYLLWLLSTVIFAFALIGEREPSIEDDEKSEYRSGGPGRLSVASCVSAVVFMFPFLVIELNTMWSYGKSWFRQFWNMIDTAMYSLQIAILVMYLDRTYVDDSSFSVILSIQCILLFAKIQYFSRVFDTSRGSLVDMLKVVISDVKWFLLFIFLTMFSFGIAFGILYRDDVNDDEEARVQEDYAFGNIPRSVVSMFAFMLGGFQFEVFYNSENEGAAVVFFLIYESIMAIMLLNLLIAIMTDAYGKVMADERLWNWCSKAQIIDELETTLPKFLTSHWNPPYVHILRIAPQKNLSLNSLWMRIDMAGEQSIKNTSDLMREADSFRTNVVTKLHEVRRKLDIRTARSSA